MSVKLPMTCASKTSGTDIVASSPHSSIKRSSMASEPSTSA